MAAIITLPGTLSSVPSGMEEAILLHSSGLPSRGLEAIFLFEEASGTTVVDDLGGSSGVIDSIGSSNNAYSRLSGGGLQLSGAQLASFPSFEQANAWTLISAGATVSDVGAVSEKIVGIIGSRDFGAAQVRGAYLYHRGATDLDVSQTTAYYQLRAANGSGGQGTVTDVIPTGINVSEERRVHALSYDGASVLESRVYDKDGVLVGSATRTVSDALLFTISGTTTSNLQWVVGGVNATYASGVHQHELAARYARSISSFSASEIEQICAASASIGADRGRAW